MNKGLAILGALGAGAAAMYLLDPDRGRSRRALIRDKAVGLGNDVKKGVTSTTRDLSNRAKGMMHEVKASMPESFKADNEVSTGVN